jgi:uncharacterized membrane protein YfcA
MHWLEIIGYLSAFVMGLSLGLIGGGGSILSVPILVYLFKIDVVTATTYSLFVVGIASFSGAINHFRLGNIHWKAVFFFGMPSIITVFLIRSFGVPRIPDPVLHWGNFIVPKPTFFLVLFGIVMLMASIAMTSKKLGSKRKPWNEEQEFRYPYISLQGLLVGCITGLVGAGGGFLIIPGLVILAKLPMKKAIGTSLAIISLNATIGFLGDLHNNVHINWMLLAIFATIAIGGILYGSNLTKRYTNEKLKPLFGWFVMVMAILIILEELLS